MTLVEGEDRYVTRTERISGTILVNLILARTSMIDGSPTLGQPWREASKYNDADIRRSHNWASKFNVL